jgi:hypothetical protein
VVVAIKIKSKRLVLRPIASTLSIALLPAAGLPEMASALAKQLTETVENYRRNTGLLKQQKRAIGTA